MRRLSREDGFTLPELLTAVSMAMIIVLATFSLLDVTMRRTSETALRVEANQRGRQAMEAIMRVLRSQVCVSFTKPAVVAANGNVLTIHANLTESAPPTQYTFRYDPSTQKLWQESVPGTSLPPDTTFTGTVRRKLLAENIAREGATPIFTYRAFNTATPPAPERVLADPVPAADLRYVTRISVNYVSKTGRGPATNAAVTFRDEVFARHADHNDPLPEPTCA